MNEQAIKSEFRLFALESVVCQYLSGFFAAAPSELFSTARAQATAGARRQTFAGADAAHSDLFSAELEAAIDRLYNMIESHLEKVRKPEAK